MPLLYNVKVENDPRVLWAKKVPTNPWRRFEEFLLHFQPRVSFCRYSTRPRCSDIRIKRNQNIFSFHYPFVIQKSLWTIPRKPVLNLSYTGPLPWGGIFCVFAYFAYFACWFYLNPAMQVPLPWGGYLKTLHDHHFSWSLSCGLQQVSLIKEIKLI